MTSVCPKNGQKVSPLEGPVDPGQYLFYKN